MFSKGTYNRYLFEVDSAQKRMVDIYHRLEGRLQDPALRKVMSDLAEQVQAEQQTVGDLRALMQSAL
ncbi:MAG TPA: hypothetical protein VLM89_06350 [Phycisphaerae bacterium]|nr:hypothetical protein [Phycisphaerae bacterium]